MNHRKAAPKPAPEELEAAIVARIARRGSIMDGMEMQQFSRTSGASPECIRGLLKKLGYSLQYTLSGRRLWKRHQ